MKRAALFLFAIGLALPLAAQERIAVIGLLHAHVWGHLGKMVKGESATLVGVAESNPDLVAEAKKLGVPDNLFYSDARKMLAETKPDIVWAFVPNNKHLQIVEMCGPKKINVIFEKPLAATYREALEIRSLAKKYGILVMTNYQMAWWSSNYVAKAQADSGAIGKVWRLRGIVGHGGPSPNGVRNKYFFEWLTDPAGNGAGSLMDFGCYNALWSLWYLGVPERVYAQANHLRPDVFPKVEDNADLVLSYKNGVGIFEASWDLPRGFQDLEVFGRGGSIYMTGGKVELRKSKAPVEDVPLEALAPERSDPVAYMVHCMRNKKPIEGLTAIDINVNVVEIIEASKMSIRRGCSIPLPLVVGAHATRKPVAAKK